MAGKKSSYRGIVEAVFAEKVGVPLADYVCDLKAEGVSWRALERDVHAVTDGAVEVSNVSLSNWYGDKAERGAA